MNAQSPSKVRLDSEIGYSFPSSMIIDDVSHLDVLVALCKAKCNIIIIHGNDDKIIPIQNSMKIIESVRARLDDNDKKNIDLQIVIGGGHNLHEETPKIVVDSIAKIINNI